MERSGEPRTVWQGFQQGCVIGTGTENQIFFFWRRTGSGGLVMEAGTNRVRPRGGGMAGVTGLEEITGFSLSTETESDLSPIWRKINFAPG